MRTEPQKKAETKQKLRDSFFELYAVKRIDKIGIKEITDRAGFNRGTFYIHYRDIYDLLEQTEEELIQVISMFADNLMEAVFHAGDIHAAFPPAEFFQRYGKYMKVLVGPNGDPSFVVRLRNFIKELFMKEINRLGLKNIDTEKAEYVFEYVSSAQIGILTHWFQNDMKMPVTKLADIIQTLTREGPIKILLSSNQ